MDSHNTVQVSRGLADEGSPDIATSSDEYAARFSGPTGRWMLGVQERIVLEVLRRHGARRVLDVGGGHGQLAVPLARCGFQVTVLASHPSCRRRLREVVAAGLCRFVVGELDSLPFPERSFDAVVSVRLLPHSRDWRGLVRELCRVADRAVVVDYPTLRSLNRLAPLLFEAKRRLEGNTRSWDLFRDREVAEEFRSQGYRLRRHPQFFLPMVLHRTLRRRRLSAGLEGCCRALGLTRLWGSPVIAEAIRAGG